MATCITGNITIAARLQIVITIQVAVSTTTETATLPARTWTKWTTTNKSVVATCITGNIAIAAIVAANTYIDEMDDEEDEVIGIYGPGGPPKPVCGQYGCVYRI